MYVFNENDFNIKLRIKYNDLSSYFAVPTVTLVDLAFQQHGDVNHLMVTLCLKGKNWCNWREREHVQP